jgi:hypothetical protein
MQDLAYRSFVTNAIEDSVKSLNAGIKTLSKLRTSTSHRLVSVRVRSIQLPWC